MLFEIRAMVAKGCTCFSTVLALGRGDVDCTWMGLGAAKAPAAFFDGAMETERCTFFFAVLALDRGDVHRARVSRSATTAPAPLSLKGTRHTANCKTLAL